MKLGHIWQASGILTKIWPLSWQMSAFTVPCHCVMKSKSIGLLPSNILHVTCVFLFTFETLNLTTNMKPMLANARNRCFREHGQFLKKGVWPLSETHWQQILFEDVFQAADFRGGLTAKWSSADAKRVREGGYTELDVELALDCEDGSTWCFSGWESGSTI